MFSCQFMTKKQQLSARLCLPLRSTLINYLFGWLVSWTFFVDLLAFQTTFNSWFSESFFCNLVNQRFLFTLCLARINWLSLASVLSRVSPNRSYGELVTCWLVSSWRLEEKCVGLNLGHRLCSLREFFRGSHSTPLIACPVLIYFNPPGAFDLSYWLHPLD